MTNDEIRKNAPDGATHYREYTGQYFKLVGSIVGVWYVWRDGSWRDSINPRFTNLKPLH